MTKVILGIDVGKNAGISVIMDGKFILSRSEKMISLLETYKLTKHLIQNLVVKAVITGKPNRMYNVIMAHAQFIGVIAMACEEANIPLIIENDSTMRAFVLGKGNGKRKDLVHEKYKGETPDVSDAMMFADYLWLQQNET
jgi:Holliday junction resolvasome RuvABC endonuclease subunit